jgi:PAS domain S-box-containing protein
MQTENLDLLQEFIDNTSELIFLISIDGEIQFMNNAVVEKLGFSRTKLNQKNIKDLLHPEFKDIVFKNLDRIKNGERLHEFVMVFRNANKNRVYLMGEVSCKYQKGQPISYRCMFRDITEKRRSEIAQNLYHSIAEINLNSRNLEDFLQKVHTDLQKNLYANNFFVAIYEPQENTLHFPYQIDEFYSGDGYNKRNIGNGLIEYAIVQNRPLLLLKNEVEQLIEKEKIFIYESHLAEIYVLVPLKIQDKTIGIIGIKSYSDATKFSNNDLSLLEFVSGQIALVLLRKQAEEKLLLQTARLNAIFDSSSHYIWTVNKKRQLSSFNKNYHNLIFEKLGLSPSENASLEKLGWRLVTDDDRPMIREKYNLAFSGLPQYFEMKWGEINGGNNWFEFYLNPILSGENGQIDEVSGIARNITEKKLALNNIQSSERKFRDIIDSFIDIYYRTDLAGNIIMISPSVLTHTGYSVEEVTGQKVEKFFENAIDSSKGIKSLLKSGSITNFEVVVKHKDGDLRQFMLNIRMIKDAKGFPVEVEGVARDISDLKNYADDLKIAKNDAEHSLKVKEQFLANMSHEIRTPMNGIIGMIDVLSETSLNPNQKDYVSTIKKSSETLLTILNDILDLSKIEAGKMEILYQALDLEDSLNNLTALFKQKALEKANELKLSIMPGTPKYIMGDQIRILQILSNLTSNALKFTQDGSVEIRVSPFSKEKNKSLLLFEVIDSGLGISEENQKKLFNSFQQLDISTKKSFGGTGLGLVISKELCQKMGGNIGLHSKLGTGSTFWFTIATEEADGSSLEKIKEENKEIRVSQYFGAYSPKVLLVDDNSINRKVASEIMLKANCTVEQADSGAKAIEIYGQHQDFDLILMDIQMPEMDGLETTRRLRQQFTDLPKIVAMTAYSMPKDRENFISQGMDDYISKPIRANLLILKIDALVDKAKMSKSEPKTRVIDEQATTTEIIEYDLEVINGLKEMVGADMLASVFEDFEREATEQIDLAYQGFLDQDVQVIQRELHTLKGNSGTLGLNLIHEYTKDIEVPSKTGDLTDFENKFEKLKASFAHFKNIYKQW